MRGLRKQNLRFLENKLEMDIENVVIERAHRTGKKIYRECLQEYMTAYSCSIFFLQGKNKYYKELQKIKKKTQSFPSLRTFLE